MGVTTPTPNAASFCKVKYQHKSLVLFTDRMVTNCPISLHNQYIIAVKRGNAIRKLSVTGSQCRREYLAFLISGDYNSGEM